MNGMIINIDKIINLNLSLLMTPFMELLMKYQKILHQNNNMMDGQLP